MKTKEELKKDFDLLKTQYRPLYTVTVPLNEDETENATVYLKKPDMATHAIVRKLASGSNPIRAVETALKNLYVGGDDISLILTNEDAILACEEPVVKVFETKTAQIKKN